MSNAIERFFASWGEPDPDVRAAAIRACLSPRIAYCDPRTPDTITNADALIAYVAMYTQYAPGATAQVVNLSSTQDVFRATVKFHMDSGNDGGNSQLGQYFIELDAQSCLTRVIGFVGLGEPE